MSNSTLVFLILSLALLSCRLNGTGTVKEETEADCLHMKTIDGLGFYFNRYPYPEMDTIQIRISEGQEKKGNWESFPVAAEMVDSLREQRYFYLERTINIKDTVFFKIKNGAVHAAYGFRYLLRPHTGSAFVAYGCDFYELYVDGKKETGGIVSLMYPKK